MGKSVAKRRNSLNYIDPRKTEVLDIASTWVAIPAWSVPGSQSVGLPFILLYLTITSYICNRVNPEDIGKQYSNIISVNYGYGKERSGKLTQKTNATARWREKEGKARRRAQKP